MKKRLFTGLILLLLTGLTACAQTSGTQTAATGQTRQEASAGESARTALVACFSATGNTRSVAEKAAQILDADLFEIVPEDPYTEEDLLYQNDACRANREQQDESARPAIASRVDHMDDYDTVILAFPIWWGQEPRNLDTFMESYDWNGKVMTAICTSGSSGIESAQKNLQAFTDESAVWLEGKRFSAGASEEEVRGWADSIGLTEEN